MTHCQHTSTRCAHTGATALVLGQPLPRPLSVHAMVRVGVSYKCQICVCQQHSRLPLSRCNMLGPAFLLCFACRAISVLAACFFAAQVIDHTARCTHTTGWCNAEATGLCLNLPPLSPYPLPPEAVRFPALTDTHTLVTATVSSAPLLVRLLDPTCCGPDITIPCLRLRRAICQCAKPDCVVVCATPVYC